MTVIRLYPDQPMPPRSPASRRCIDCGETDPDGTLGPPGVGLVVYLGGTRLEDLSGLWLCSHCSRCRWAAWRDPGGVQRRRDEVFAEVERRRLILWRRFGPPQLLLFQVAS